MVGFATWDLPKPDAPKRKDRVAEEVNGTSGIKKSRDLPEIPGVNTELWGEKVDGPKEAHVRDVEESEDICRLLFCSWFVDVGELENWLISCSAVVIFF